MDGTNENASEIQTVANDVMSAKVSTNDKTGNDKVFKNGTELQPVPFPDDKSTEKDIHDEEKAKEVRAIKLNLAAICVVWVFTFTAYSGLQNLESSLNASIGTYSLAGLTGGGFLTCLLAPAVISKTGCKGALIISWLCLAVFVGANYYPKAYVLIPGAAIEGLATGLMWTAQGVYVTSCAFEYSQLTGEALDEVLSRMFGLFCMAFQSTQVWGNLISSVVLNKEHSGSGAQNSTNRPQCGADFCPATTIPNSPNSTTSSNTEDTLMITLISVYMGFVVTGLFVTVIFLRPVKPRGVSQSPGTIRLLTSTVRLLFSDVNMALLVPFSLYLGLEQAVLFAEFTSAYVTCELGVGYVGYTMLCFGVCDTVASPVAGIIGKYLKRTPLIFGAAALNAVTLLSMLLWRPAAEEKYIFFILPAVWGLADGVWQTQSGALIGSVFRDQQEPAFANLRMWQALGFTIAYLYSGHLCVSVKLYIAFAVLVTSVVLVFIVEMRHKQKKSFKYGQM